MRPTENKFNDKLNLLRVTGSRIRPILTKSSVKPAASLEKENGKSLFTVTVALTEKGEQILSALETFICQEFNVTREELKSEGRYMPLPKARGAFTSILRLKFDFPLKLIGTHLGGRDHSSILMAERRAKDFYIKNGAYRVSYDNVEREFLKYLSDNEFTPVSYITKHDSGRRDIRNIG